MYRGKVIAAVVPCHNEAEFLAGVLGGIGEYVDHVLVVDDASTDGTVACAAGVARYDRRVRLVRMERNQGVGGATKRGYADVLAELPDVDVVVKLDGDGQMPLEKLSELLDPVVTGAYDYAKGNRFLMDRELARMPSTRLWGNVTLTFMTKFASGYWNLFDVQNGMTAIARGCLERLDIAGVHDGYFFENDMLVRLNAIGCRVKDVPMPSRYGDEVSGVHIGRVALTFPWLLFKRFWWRVYRKYMLYDLSPVALFLVTGVVLFGFGAVLAAFLWAHSVATGRATPTGTLLIDLVLIVLGFQLLLQSVVLDIQNADQLAGPRVESVPERGGTDRATDEGAAQEWRSSRPTTSTRLPRGSGKRSPTPKSSKPGEAAPR